MKDTEWWPMSLALWGHGRALVLALMWAWTVGWGEAGPQSLPGGVTVIVGMPSFPECLLFMPRLQAWDWSP